MVADEHGGGDAPEGLVEARISAKDSGILCGRPVAERLLARHFSECSAEWGVSEGGTVEKGQTLHCYWSSACETCAIKAQCTSAAQRRVKRWEHESVLETMQQRWIGTRT